MKLRALTSLIPLLATTGCLTVPQISDELSRTASETTFQVPEPACDSVRTELAGIPSRMDASHRRAGANEEENVRMTLDALAADPGTEIGKLFAATLPAPTRTTGKAASVVIPVSAKKLAMELRAVMEVSQFEPEDVSRVASQSKRFAMYSHYFQGYFRKGKVLDVTIGKEEALERIKQDLRNGLNVPDGETPPQEIQKIIDSAAEALMKLVCKDDKCALIKADPTMFFVNRAGQKFGFPVVAFTIKPGTDKGFEVTKLDEIQVIGDLTRIFWEAAFDSALEGGNVKPFADAAATACVVQKDKKPIFDVFKCTKAGEEKNLEALGKLNVVADRTEGVAAYVAAQVVRGAWFASLDNEALAKLLQTSVSVVARKAAEVAYTANQSCKTREPATFRRVTIRFAS